MLVTESKSKRGLKFVETKNPFVKDQTRPSNFSHLLTQLVCCSYNSISRNFNSSIYSSEQKQEAHKDWYITSHNFTGHIDLFTGDKDGTKNINTGS